MSDAQDQKCFVLGGTSAECRYSDTNLKVVLSSSDNKRSVDV